MEISNRYLVWGPKEKILYNINNFDIFGDPYYDQINGTDIKDILESINKVETD